ncbi:MAG: hypothetical protein ACHP9T_14970 [Caulobacterales bacterium]|jgi:uncharacterized protein YcfJ
MRKTLTLTATAAILALPLIFGSTDANASCRGRANTGTAIGAIGGALLGNSISHGGGGAVLGGLGGAVVGHQIAKGGCDTSRHSYYRRGRNHYATTYDNRYADGRDGRYARARDNRVYYDARGNAVYPR